MMPRQSTSAVSRLAASHDSTMISTYRCTGRIEQLSQVCRRARLSCRRQRRTGIAHQRSHSERRQASAGASVTHMM